MAGSIQDFVSRKKTLLIVLAIFWLLLLGGIGGIVLLFQMVAAGKLGELPTFEQLENPQNALASEVWSADGEVLGKYYSQNRTNARFDELPENLVNALMATEDIRYHEHAGIDFIALFRAIKGVITMDMAGGGSTITQQLAKNLFHDRPKSSIDRIRQKLMEWVIAVRLESRYTKDEIITMYFNTVEFSDNAFGIKSAAKTYFNKEVDSLNVEQSAVLVGMLKAPYKYNPRLFPDRSKLRRDVVLDQMYKYDFIPEELYDSLHAMPIVLDFKRSDHVEGLAPYFREHLRMELQKWFDKNPKVDGSKYDIYKDGLKIYVTIDSRMQAYAEEAANQHMTELQKDFFNHWKGRDPWKEFPEELRRIVKQSDRYKLLKAEGMPEDSIMMELKKPVEMTVFSYKGEIDTTMSPLDSIRYHRMFLQTGMMAVDPKSGEVKAWVGGVNYKYFQFDHITSKRQIGSTFKPFLYATAVDNGYSPCFKVLDLPVTFENYNNWTPDNSDGKFSGQKMTLKHCLANSINSCSAYLIKQIGPQPVIDLVRRLGIDSHIDPYPSICLGTPDISLSEMAGSYTAFANKGVYTQPVFISRIEDKNGNLVHEFTTSKVEAMSEQTAYVMVEMLRNVVNHGTGVRLRFKYKMYNDMGGKTGTTQNQSDGWFMGITPDLIAGVWVGGEDRFMRFRSIALGQGANMALPIWGLFFQKVFADQELAYDKDKRFEQPDFDLTIELDCSKYEKKTSSETPPQRTNTYGSEFD